MKNIIRFIVCVCFSAIAVSCSTSTKIMVSATPGTEILTPQKKLLAVANGAGKAQVKISDDTYYAFLLSHTPNTSDFVPFALDYKYKNYVGTKIQEYIGYGLVGLGTFSILGGLFDAIFVGLDDGLMPVFFGIGAGLDAVGGGLLFPAACRGGQTNHEYSYKFYEYQKTNQDIRFTTPTFDVYSAHTVASDTRGTVSASKKKLKASSSNGISVSSKKLGSSTSSKTLKDNASRVEGTYVGTGSLSQNNSVIEKYQGISVTIKKSGKDVVLVNVIESDGEKFFDSDGEYTVKKLANGKYELTLVNVKTAKITIDTKSNLIYIHPRVNIEGEIYSLNINAKKQ